MTAEETGSPRWRSPLLDLPGAVEADGIDAGVAAHYGSFNGEQRALLAADGFVDLSHHDVFRVSGPDRLGWLHSLTTQALEDLPPGQATTALVLSPQGHVEHAFTGVDDGEAFVAHTEPGLGAGLVDWLDRMRFMMRVEVELMPDQALAWRATEEGGRHELVPRDRLSAYAAAAGEPCGLWAYEALRIARGSRGWGWTPITRPSPTRPGGSAPRCISTRAAIGARRPWHACTRWGGRRDG